jgi:thiol-disulfide isomerase/thioredoxin
MEATAELAVSETLHVCETQAPGRCVPYAIDDEIVFDSKKWPTLWGPYKTSAELNTVKIGRARGERFFDLAFKGPAGNTMKLSDFRGQVTVLHFWAAWCPPCRSEMPEIQKVQQKLGANSGVQLVLLQVREDIATSKRWAAQKNLSLPLYDSGVKAKGESLLTLANGAGIQDRELAQIFPTTYVLDRHGIVVFSHEGPIEGWPQYLPFLRDVVKNSGK